MSDTSAIPLLERIEFLDGQQLTAEDLTEFKNSNTELRWLHARSLHSWGIGIGFDVQGNRGDSSVSIGSGYAVDCLGREVILSSERTKTVPAVPGQMDGTDATYYLIAAYLRDADQAVVETRPGVCVSGGTVRLTEEPFIAWRLPNELREGQDLVLARASILNCQLSRPLSLTERRYARPCQQPYIGAGQTEAGRTNWQVWLDSKAQPIGVFTSVDTSSALFRTTPTYMAHIVGERILVQGPKSTVLVAFAGLVDATPDRFTLQVFFPRFGKTAPNVNPNQLFQSSGPQGILGVVQQLNWQVVWMGTEG